MGFMTGMGLSALALNMILALSNKAKKVKARLLDLESSEQDLFYQHPDWVLTMDLKGKIVKTNRKIESYGYTEKEMLKKFLVTFIVSDQVDYTKEQFGITKNGVSTNFDTLFSGAKGEILEFNITTIPIKVDGQVVGIYGIVKELTKNRAISVSNQEALNSKQSAVEVDLQNALENQEFQLHYQPKINLTSGKIAGVEALIRWQHPDKGLIAPKEFISLAEETGLIIPIGEWVLHTACSQNKAWQEQGLPHMVLSVNISVQQLYQPDFIGMIKRILKETGLAPHYLELEIMERNLIDNGEGYKVLKVLRSIGVQISLNESGSTSSLHQLRDFPINKFIIDQSFVRDGIEDTNGAETIKSIIAKANQLNLEVVAVGVESKEDLKFLQQNCCDEVQGFLFSKPLPPKEFVQSFDKIETSVQHYGVFEELSNQKWMKKSLQIAREELIETIRQQQGMIFKYIKVNDKFIHTFCEGGLLLKLGFVPEQVVGKELYEFLPHHTAVRKTDHLRLAWEGNDNIMYEAEGNGIRYVTSLRPVWREGQVVEVIGSSIDITERMQIEEALRVSESKYRLIAENMMDLIGVVDLSGTGLIGQRH